MHTNSGLMFQKYAKQYFCPGLRVLEIGPDGTPSTYQKLVGDSSLVWHTLDMRDDPSLTYRALSEYKFPVESGSYDIVLSGNVIEHVRQIWTWVQELTRICKTNGVVVTINPVSWPYHEAPVDCWRAYPEGMRALYGYSKLEVLLSEWGCLEGNGQGRILPGRSAEFQSWRLRWAYSILGVMGFPVERAYDTITIGRKT